jgi:hypothetical protein
LWELAAQAADRPEKGAQQNTDKDWGCQGEGDWPSPPAPVEVAGKTAEWQIEAGKPNDHYPDDYQEEAKKNKDAAQVRHTAIRLDGSEQSGCFAKKLWGLAWFGQHSQRAWQLARLLTDTLQVGVETRQHKNAARWKLARHVFYQREAVATGHGYVTQKKMRREFAGALQRFVGWVCCLGLEAVPLEYEGKGVGNQTIIINHQNSLHVPPFSKSIFVRLKTNPVQSA